MVINSPNGYHAIKSFKIKILFIIALMCKQFKIVKINSFNVVIQKY